MKTSVAIVGTGQMARNHIEGMLKQAGTTTITALVEISDKQRKATAAIFAQHKKKCPPFYASITELLAKGNKPDTAFIVTPHKYHLENTTECLTNGIDVLLEKPMVLNGTEARKLIAVRNRTKRLVVVGFPGSLSPAIKTAKKLLAEGRIGPVTGIAAHVHQCWKYGSSGTWRQDPKISGGGFLFDTGSHMINTVVDLIGQDVSEVTAILDNRGTPVEINSIVGGRFADGTIFSLAGIGDAEGCCSQIRVFGQNGTLETGIWGEYLSLKKQKEYDFKPVKCPQHKGVWKQFLAVRDGRLENPCPPEVGLRFAQLMDMIRKSAATGKLIRR